MSRIHTLDDGDLVYTMSDHNRPSQSSGKRITEGEKKPDRELLLLVQGGSEKTPQEITKLAMDALVKAGAVTPDKLDSDSEH